MNCSLIGGTTLTIRQGSKTPFVHGQMKMPNANLQVIELNPRCSGQAYFKGLELAPQMKTLSMNVLLRVLCLHM